MGSNQPALLGRRLSWHTYRVWHASLPAGKGDKGERKADKGEGIRTHAKKGQRKGEPSLGAERLSLQPPRLMWESLSS